MQVDQLPAHQQEAVSYCHSCLEVRSEDELGTCIQCGYRICGMKGCSAMCACDDAVTELMWQIDANLETIGARIKRGNCPPPPAISPECYAAIMQDIDRALASVNGIPA